MGDGSRPENGLIASQKPGMVHAMQVAPARTGQLVPEAYRTDAQLAKLSGPLQPIL